MVKIRLMRIGAKKRPFYRVVAIDERAKRNGEYLELLGTYNPLTQPKEIKLKQDLIDAWIKKGAVLSDGFLRVIGKAPQRVARKPKKAQNNSEPAAPKAVEEAEKVSEVSKEPESQVEEAVEVADEPKVTEEPKVEEVATEEIAPAEEEKAA